MVKNRIIYTLFLGLSIAFSYLYQGPVSSLFFYTILTLPVISCMYTLYMYGRFSYIQKVDQKFITKGETAHLNIEIINKTSMIYPHVKIIGYGGYPKGRRSFQEKKIPILPKGIGRVHFSWACPYRGYYELGLKEIYIRDFLGFFNLKYRVLKPESIAVYPRIIFLEKFPIATYKTSDMEGLLNKKEEDRLMLSDLRKYAYGDSLRKVHWKLSAKKDEIMVKNFDDTVNLGALILLDLSKNSYESLKNMILEDKCIEASVAILHYCLRQQIEIQLIYHNGESIIQEKAEAYGQFELFYERLFKAKFESTMGFDEVLKWTLSDKPREQQVILITSNLNEKIYTQVSLWQELKVQIILIYISPLKLVPLDETQLFERKKILAALRDINVKLYEIHINDDMKAILEC